MADNGPGIADSIKSNLFDPTTRLGELGLLVARHIVEKYGGIFTFADRVQGSPAQGAEFHMSATGIMRLYGLAKGWWSLHVVW